MIKNENKELAEKHVLVTGGAGFIGSELVRQLLNSGANVTVLDNFSSGKKNYLDGLNVKIINGDVCDEMCVLDAVKNQEIVFHLAALPFIPDCYINPKQFFHVNTTGTLNLIWAAIKSGSAERFVHVSTSEVYGTAQYVPMDENHPLNPHSTYAVSKLAADRVVFTLHKEQDFPAVIIRPFNSYGPRITQPYIIPELMIQLLNSDTLQLGNVESSRDFTFVSDTSRGMVMASVEKKAVGETINIGSGGDITIKDLAYLIAELLNKKDKIKIKLDESRLRPYDVTRLFCDPSKAKRILGWEPSIPIREGLKTTLDWVKNNPIEYKGPYREQPKVREQKNP